MADSDDPVPKPSVPDPAKSVPASARPASAVAPPDNAQPPLLTPSRDAVPAFFAMRSWQDEHMPVYGSFIGLDLVIFLYQSRVTATPYSLKDVFHSLSYSEGALRIFIRRLERDGWITLATWPGDRRNKKIIVSDMLEQVVLDYLRHMRAIV